MTHWLRRLAILAAAPLLTAAAPAAPKDMQAVTVVAGGNSLGCFGPAFLAMQEGFFEQAGLKVDLTIVGGGTVAVAALVGGQASIGMTGAAQIVQTIAQGKDLRIIAGLIDNMNAKIVVGKRVAERQRLTAASPLGEKVRALKGLRIGVSQAGDTSYNLVTVLLRQHGIDPEKDVEMINLKLGGPMLAALRQGTIDAFSISSPFPEQAEALGLGLALISPPRGDVPEMKGMYYCSVSSVAEVMRTAPDVLVRFIKGLVMAGEVIAKDQARARRGLRAHFKDIDEVTFDTAFASNYPVLVRDPEPTRQNIEALVKFWAATGGGDAKAMPFERVAEPRFARQAKAELRK